MRASLRILSLALALSGYASIPAAVAHKGDRVVVHMCAHRAGGILRAVAIDEDCRSDERPIHLGRQIVVTDANGVVVGTLWQPGGNRSGVIVKVGKLWTEAEVSRTAIQFAINSIGDRLRHEQEDCGGDPYIANQHVTGSFFTLVMTIGPSYSAYARDPRTPARTITVLSERLSDGSCVNTAPYTWGNQTRARFIEDLNYVPPFTLRFIP